MRCTHSTLVLWSTPADRGTDSSGVGGAWPSYHVQKAELGESAGVGGAWPLYRVQKAELGESSGVS